MTRPHIVFIHTDSLDGRKLGRMGHPALAGVTPNLDRLAAEGIQFTRAYANNAICCPSRASMWSGRFTHRCEGWNNFKGLEEGDRTFRDELEQAGYRTRVIGKTDFTAGRHSVRARVSAWLRTAGLDWTDARPVELTVRAGAGDRGHPTEWEKAEMATAWLREHARDGSPLFLYLGLRKPHFPFVTSDRWLDRIDPAAVDLPAVDECRHPAVAAQRRAQKGDAVAGMSPATKAHLRRIYLAMIAEVDATVGRVLEGLAAAGLADDAVVIFSSDHGELAGEHGMLHKGSAYEGSVRVPLIARGPGVRAGARVDTPVSLVDLYPTLMDIAGQPCPADLDGVSLAPALAGRPTAHPGWLLAEYHDTGCPTSWFMLRQDGWKYVAWPGYEPQLFDLDADPDELCDRAPDHPHQVLAMERQLREIVDYPAVAHRVRAYDRESFCAWRAERRSAGDYESWMACFAAGYKDPAVAPAVPPWSAADEERIAGWLAGTSVAAPTEAR